MKAVINISFVSVILAILGYSIYFICSMIMAPMATEPSLQPFYYVLAGGLVVLTTIAKLDE